MSRKKFRDFKSIMVGLLCLAGLIVSQDIFSQSLTKEEAFEWAKAWHSGSTLLKSSPAPEIQEVRGLKNKKSVFLADFDNSGFVIFSNDSHPVVLGYSFENGLPEDSNHPLYTEWIPSFSKQLSEAKIPSKKALKTGPPDVPGFDELVEPLIDAKWGQAYPWNKYCPSDTNGHHAPVGCVAVALAQIMNKWEWPVKGKGQNSYIPSAHRDYGTVEAVFDTTYYQWDQMKDTEASDASALLLFHTGVASFMNYAPNESGANSSVNAEIAMVEHFYYNSDMIFREREPYSYNEWTQLLRQDVINDRPVFYRGTDPDGGLGHAFVIDGFRDEYFFHFNWGWNGQGDGYYRLEAMADGGGNFVNGQAALFGIQPSDQPQHDRPFAMKLLAGDGFVQLFWDEPLVKNLSHYNIYRNGEIIQSTWETSFRDEGLVNGTDYTYYLTAEYVGDTPGESSPTPEMDISPWKSMELPYTQNFNDSLAGWQIKDTRTTFQWKRADSLGFGGNGSKLIGIRSDSAGVGNKVTDYLISPILDLRQMDGAAIKFDYVFQQVPHVDYLFLMYRRFDNGLWYPIFRLDSTNSWADWRTHYGYFPDGAKNTLIQLGFFYTDYNGVGKGAGIDNITIFNVEDIPIPDFDVSKNLVCQDIPIIVSDSSIGPVTHWAWDFGEGAEPRYSNEPGPHEVIYRTGGLKDIYLEVNHLDPITKQNYVDVSWETKADFEYSRESLTVSFNNLSEHPQFVHWDFGDGSTSEELNPVYMYKSKLEFDVEMISYSPPCVSDTVRMHLDLRNGTGIEEILFEESIKIYPNPASTHLNISWNNIDSKFIYIDLVGTNGSVVKSMSSNTSGDHYFDLSGISDGFYWLRISKDGMVTYRKTIIYN